MKKRKGFLAESSYGVRFFESAPLSMRKCAKGMALVMAGMLLFFAAFGAYAESPDAAANAQQAGQPAADTTPAPDTASSPAPDAEKGTSSGTEGDGGKKEESSQLPAAKVSISVSPQPCIAEQSARIKVSVSSKGGGKLTGSLSIKVNNTVIASKLSVSDGSASASWTPPSAGTYTVSAQYTPGKKDACRAGSASTSVTVSSPDTTGDPVFTPVQPESGQSGQGVPDAYTSIQPEGGQQGQTLPGTDMPIQPEGGQQGQTLPGTGTPVQPDGGQGGQALPGTVAFVQPQPPAGDPVPAPDAGDSTQRAAEQLAHVQEVTDLRSQLRQQGQNLPGTPEAAVQPPETQPAAPNGIGLSIAGPASARTGDVISITVGLSAPTGAAPTGSVTLAGSGIGEISQGTPVSGGFGFTAKVTATEGGITVVASYVGADYVGTTSTTIPLEAAPSMAMSAVQAAAPTLTMSASASPSQAAPGETVTVTVTASAGNGGGVPAGNVSISCPGLTDIPASVGFVNGIATVTAKASVIAGAHTVTATYSGLDYPSTTVTCPLAVGQAEMAQNTMMSLQMMPMTALNQLAMSIDFTPNPVRAGQYMTVAVIANTGSGVGPSGRVQLTSNAPGVQFPATAIQFSGGRATFTSTGPVPSNIGDFSLTATYTSAGGNDYLGNTATQNVPINRVALSQANTQVYMTPQNQTYYPGMRVTPSLRVMVGGVQLTENIHYTLSPTPYQLQLTTAGTTAFTIQGINTYSGSATANYVIAPKSVAGVSVAPIPSQNVGGAVQPRPDVWDGGYRLNENVDFTYGYEQNNTLPGQKSMTINGLGNYTGTRTVYYQVVGRSIQDGAITTEPSAFQPQQYTGGVIKPPIVVKDNGQVLTEGVHYNVVYPFAMNPGTHYISINGISPYYTGGITRSFQIESKRTTLSVRATGGNYGAPVVLSADVRSTAQGYGYGGMVTSGTVVFEVAGMQYPANVYNGIATLSPGITGLSAGTHIVTARYQGGGIYDDSAQVSTTVRVTVNPATQPRFEITGGYEGQALVLYLSIPPQNGATPGGVAVFTDGIHTYEEYFNQQGVAAVSFPYSTLEYGRTYKFTASYVGDGNYAPFPATSRSVTIGQSGQNVPRVALTVFGGYSGKPAQITVSVVRLPGGPTPTGWVVLQSGQYVVERLRLNQQGEASCTWYNVPGDATQIAAYYEGDANYNKAASGIVAIGNSANAAAINLSAKMIGSSREAQLIVSMGNRWWNQTDNRFTNPYGGQQYQGPTGWISFYANNRLLDTVRLTNGEAAMTWTDVPVGTHTILAVYSGDASFGSGRASVKLTRKGSGGPRSSSSSTSTAAVTPTTSGGITLRDAAGTVVQTYDVATLQTMENALLVQTAQNMNAYSFGIPLSLFYENAAVDGYINLVVPDLNVLVPYDLVDTVEGLSEYLGANRFSNNQLELRIAIEKVDPSAVPLNASGLDAASMSTLYRLTLSLSDAAGSKYNFTPGTFLSPMQLLLPNTKGVRAAIFYDETTGAFTPAGVAEADGAAVVTVDQNGVYAAEWVGK